MRWLRFFPIFLFLFTEPITTWAEPEAWRGSWIWCEGDPSPKNFYLYCRKTLDIAGEVQSATLRMTADSRYVLHVNGTQVGRGPIRSDPRWQSYDEWNIAPFLRQGRNAVTVLVHHYGESTFSYIQGRGGLIVDGSVHLADGTAIDVISDESWKVRPAEAWIRDMPRMNLQLGFSEIFDANKEPSTWMTLGFDDSFWTPATVIGKHPLEPWTQLVAHNIPAATGEPVFPKQVVSVNNVVGVENQFHFNFSSLISPDERGVAYAYTQVFSDVDRDLELVCGSSNGLHVWLADQSVIENNVKRESSPNQDRVKVAISSGWTPLLAKVTQTEDEWALFLRFEGDGIERLRYSSTQDQGQTRPVWHLLGPFENENNTGFGVVYPPEVAVDLSASYAGKGEKQITWQRHEI
ncbi:MAG: alpha-L-rhamnosidase N-terminal domain-containing protein, partial [bacterium]